MTSGKIVETFNVFRKMAYNIKKCLVSNSNGNVKRKPRSSVKFSVANKTFKAKVKAWNMRNTLKTMRAIIRDMNVSEKNVIRVVINGIRVKSWIHWILKTKAPVIFSDEKYLTRSVTAEQTATSLPWGLRMSLMTLKQSVRLNTPRLWFLAWMLWMASQYPYVSTMRLQDA